MKEEEYIGHFSALVELEREEQMRLHEEEMKRLSGRQREEKGRAFIKMRGKSQGLGLGGKHMVRFTKQDGTKLPESEIEVGDLVLVSKPGTAPWDEGNPTGTVAEKTSYSIVVAFDDAPPGFVFRKDVRIDLFVNDVTFQRMKDALKAFKRLPEWRRAKLLGKTEPEFNAGDGDELEFFNESLNNSQREAVRKSLAARDFFLIHGPPGTGKTITCVEVISQLVSRGYRVLATADSNIAVDNLVERLDKAGLDVVRIGHPARVIPALRRRSIDYLVQDDPDYKKAQELREKAYAIKERMERFTFPAMRWRRGLSDDAILRLANEGKTTRGIPKKKIEGMKRWIELKKNVDALFSDARALEDKAVKRILRNAAVICVTNSTAGSELLGGEKFDFAVIDEATQSTEPSSLIPVLKAKRFIMAGDHKQLPPTVLNEEAMRGGLSRSMFERLLALYGDKIRVMLEVQYRMNEEIAEFPNNEFYEGRLRADERVRRQTIADLVPSITKLEFILAEKPFVFIDTAYSAGFEERMRRGSTSRENEGEARLVKFIVERLLDAGARAEDIAVISPYDDQVALIRMMLRVEGLEIKTVDGFQGREKEVVIVSFVRSNKSGDIGFLGDLRRLNVSITRAKRKLILIGDSQTLGSERCYRRLIALAKSRGGYKRV
ncbi:IGHMBP2 family helicase [Methanophagales archaeon]|nr:MAG: IGHMBP2 family helicase [Methanophagales archaeon]